MTEYAMLISAIPKLVESIEKLQKVSKETPQGIVSDGLAKRAPDLIVAMGKETAGVVWEQGGKEALGVFSRIGSGLIAPRSLERIPLSWNSLLNKVMDKIGLDDLSQEEIAEGTWLSNPTAYPKGIYDYTQKTGQDEFSHIVVTHKPKQQKLVHEMLKEQPEGFDGFKPAVITSKELLEAMHKARVLDPEKHESFSKKWKKEGDGLDMTSVLEDPEFEQDLSETMHPPKMMISLAQAQEMDHKRKGAPKSEPEVEKKKDSGLSRDM